MPKRAKKLYQILPVRVENSCKLENLLTYLSGNHERQQTSNVVLVMAFSFKKNKKEKKKKELQVWLRISEYSQEKFRFLLCSRIYNFFRFLEFTFCVFQIPRHLKPCSLGFFYYGFFATVFLFLLQFPQCELHSLESEF